MDPKLFEEMSRKFTEALPPPLKSFKDEIEKAWRESFKYCFSKMNLITREEFDIQAELLARTRAKLEALEERVRTLEEQS
jgi:ubiquinone biosynthesis accessory factor UbiK